MILACLTYFVLSFNLPPNVPILDNAYLQGVWAVDLAESNALFAVQGDSIYYLDEPLKAYHYKVINSTQFQIAFDDFYELVNVIIYTESTMAFLEADGKPSITLYKRDK